MTLEDVKQLLGHSSITLTSSTYGHVLEQHERQVARAMAAVLGEGEPLGVTLAVGGAMSHHHGVGIQKEAS